MDSLEGGAPIKKPGFLEYVFNFDRQVKSDILNTIQYVALLLLPLAYMDAAMRNIFPGAREDRSTIGLLGEIFGETVLAILAILFIHRVITYIPTYSGVPVGALNIWTLVVGFVVAMFSADNVINVKVKILIDRLEGTLNGAEDGEKKAADGVVKVSQPISPPRTMPTHQVSQADYLGTHRQLAPPPPPASLPPPPTQQEAQGPTSQSIYGGPSTPLVDAQTPGATFEPMAANAVLGGGSFSAW